jgi:hypothetical protein
MMVKHYVEYIDLPLTDSMLEHANDEYEVIEDRGIASVLLLIRSEEQQQTASKSKPSIVGNTHELKVAIVTYLKENRPDLLDCQVAEMALHEHGHKVLWTPPCYYCVWNSAQSCFGQPAKIMPL